MWKHAKWPKNVKWTITGIFAFLTLVSGIANASASGTTQQPASAPTQQVVQTASTKMPLQKPTATPTPSPTPTPTPTTSPTPTPEPVQQQAPVQQPSGGGGQPSGGGQSAPPSHPSSMPDGAPWNPWGYDFESGNTISSPPSAFCNYFSCINNFPNGKGHVEECQDATYSKSGGISGSCSKHGGDWRALYSH